jgi:hypothetical protein
LAWQTVLSAALSPIGAETGNVMSLIAKAILLRKQLKSDHSKQCGRCLQVYDRRLDQCPHCTGMDDRQVELLKNEQKGMQIGNVLHILLVFGVLAFCFAVLIWIF